MATNSHNPTINESPKPWRVALTQEDYDRRVLSAKEFMKKYRVTRREYDRMLEN